MIGTGKVLGVLVGGVVAAATAFAAPPSAVPALPMTPASLPALPNTAGEVRINLSQAVAADYRDAVMKVVKYPTISTKATAPDVICTVSMYEWLFDHPDRVSLAWQ